VTTRGELPFRFEVEQAHPGLRLEPVTQELPPTPMVYRNVVLVLVRGGAVLLVALVILLGMIMYAITTLPHAGTASRITAAVATVIALLLVWLAIRTIGSRITATADGVFVHTVFRRCQYLPWTSVTGFELIPAPRFNNRFTRSAVAIAVIRSHERKPAYCLGASFTQPSPAADAMVEALRSEQCHRQPVTRSA
jgi:hypothetical protein